MHHIDGNPKNNHINNLKVITYKQHSLEHGISENMKHDNPVWKMSSEQRKIAIEKTRMKIKGLKRSLEQRLRYRESKIGIKNPRFNGKGNCKSRIKEINHKIIKVEKLSYKEDTYDLEVPSTHWFFANGVLIHNSFCEDRMTAVKWSSIENIRAELDDINNLGYGGVYIFDDIFAIAMPKVRPICEELAKRDLSYRCNGQVRYFTKWGEDFALMLASTGCREIAFGFETGSQTILDNVMKGTSVKQNYLAVQYAKKFGLKVKGFMMIGLPGETMKTIEETETFIRESGMDDFQLAIYYPYKGTKISDDIDAGNSDVNLSFLGEGLGAYGQKGGSTECVISVGDLSSADLLRERDRIVKFYKPKSHEEKWKDKFFETYLKDHESEGHFEGEF